MSSVANKRSLLHSNSDDSSEETEKMPQAKKGKFSSSGSSSEESDVEWTAEQGNEDKKKQLKKRGAQSGQRSHADSSKKDSKAQVSTSDSEDENNPATNQTTSSSSDSSDSEGDENSTSAEEVYEFDDGLGVDLVKDEEDRKMLGAMTEAEREQEFFKRHEQREALKARFEIEMKLRMEKKQEKKIKNLEKKSKRQNRPLRTKEPKRNKTMLAIDELKAKRTADKQKRAAEAEKRHDNQSSVREPLKASDVFSDSSGDSDSSSSNGDDEEEEDKDKSGERSSSHVKAEANVPVSSIEELSRIKISRFRLEKWVHMPFFAEIIKGCYVRVGIGQHEGRMVYRICEVVGVTETPKIYTLGSTKTNKGLKLRFGVQERVFRMEYVSNSAFTDQEFIKWKNENESHHIKLPTVLSIEKKAKEIESSKNANLKEEDIDKIIMEKQKFRKNPHNYALTKNRLLREKEIAEQSGESDRAASIMKQLEELEERAEELDKQRTKGLSAISYINERNRQRNVERAEEALKEEMASIKEKEEDPFTRRKCMPRLVTFGKDITSTIDEMETHSSQESGLTGLIAGEEQTLHASEQSRRDLRQIENLDLTVLDTPPTRVTNTSQVDDLFSAHDFDINIDLPQETQDPPTVKTLSSTVTTHRNDGPRKSLNLSDYKKRRGLI